MLEVLPEWSLNFVPIIAVGIWALFRPWEKEHVWGWIGVATAIASPILSRLWTLSDDLETARLLWHAGLWGVLAMYATIMVALGRQVWPAFTAMAAGLALLVLYNAGWHQIGINRHWITLALMIAIAAVVVTIFLEFTRDQLFERLIWAIRTIGEAFALVEFVLCQGLRLEESQAWLANTWGTDSSKYVCGRAFGEFWPHMPLMITTVFLVWIVYQHAGTVAPRS